MTRRVPLPLAAVAAVGLLAVPARGDSGGSLRAQLRARNEVPIVVSPATGRFRAAVA
jgi:hypothetical protein